MGKRNVASGNDRVAVQAGEVLGRSAKGSKPASPAVDSQPGTTTNVRSGNARVGQQADVITDGITIIV